MHNSCWQASLLTQALALFGAEPAALGQQCPSALEMGPPEARHRREMFAGLADALALPQQPESAPAADQPPPQVLLPAARAAAAADKNGKGEGSGAEHVALLMVLVHNPLQLPCVPAPVDLPPCHSRCLTDGTTGCSCQGHQRRWGWTRLLQKLHEQQQQQLHWPGTRRLCASCAWPCTDLLDRVCFTAPSLK